MEQTRRQMQAYLDGYRLPDWLTNSQRVSRRSTCRTILVANLTDWRHTVSIPG